jgi:hypothetical protein
VIARLSGSDDMDMIEPLQEAFVSLSFSRLTARGAVALAATCLLVAVPLVIIADGPFGAIRVAANRGAYTGKCPVEIIYTANVNLTMPHAQGLAFNYHFERSDGAKTQVEVVRPAEKDRLLIYKDTWTLGAAGQTYTASVTFFVNSGNTHEQAATPPIKIVCK